jgi:O-antigen/teichoic acid export membrane protein
MSTRQATGGEATPVAAGGVRVSARQSARAYIASVAGSYALLGASFLVSVFLTRTLGPEGFGRLTLAFAIAHTAALLSGFWTLAGFLRYGAEELAVAGSLRRVFWARLLVAAPAVLAFLLLAPVLAETMAAFHGVAGVGSALLLAYFLTLFVGQTFQVVFQARGRSGTFAMLQAGERSLLLIGLVGLAAVRPPSAGEIFVVYLTAGALGCAAALMGTTRGDILPAETSPATVRRLVLFSWPMLIGVFGSYFASNWLDVTIIRHYLGAAAVGQYSLAHQLMGAVQQIPTTAFPVIVPYLVGAQVAVRDESIRLYLERAVPHAVFAMVVVLSAAVVVGPALVRVVFGPVFAESARALPVLLLAVGWYCVFIGYIPLLNLRESTPGMLAASLVAAATNLAGDLLLVPAWGVIGAAWATVLAQAGSALVVAAIVQRADVFPLAPVLFHLLPLTLLVVVHVATESGVVLAAAAVLAAMLCAAAARAQRLGSAADRRLLAGLELPLLGRLLPPPHREKT